MGWRKIILRFDRFRRNKRINTIKINKIIEKKPKKELDEVLFLFNKKNEGKILENKPDKQQQNNVN